MHKGLYFTKVQVIHPKNGPSEINLSCGLTVISGASNTGKSYLFQCMDYILGAGSEPKDIEEAKGCVEVRAEIKTYKGETFSISRKFGDTKIYVAECFLSDFNKTETKQLSAKHSSKNDNNISTFLLNLLGLKGKKLRKNNLNEKQEISFRDVARFCLVNEEKIISEDSPIYSGQFVIV